MARGNALDTAPFDGFVGYFPWAPVTDGTPRGFGRLTGQRHDLTPLLGTEEGWSTWAWGIVEALGHRLRLTLQPVSPPATYGETAGVQAAGHFSGVVASGQLQDELGSTAIVLGRFVGTGQGKDLSTLAFRQGNGGRFGARHTGLL